MVLERRHALWLLIAAVHAGLLAGLVPRRPAPVEGARQLVALKLLPLPRATVPDTKPPPLRTPPPARPVRPALPPLAQPATPAPQPEALEPVKEPAETRPTPAPAPSLLTSEATRQAVRMAARTPLLSERAASASRDPGRENAQQRFGREVANTAYGNCLKGEFPGGGMGLLSLPFWIAAETTGKCKK